jgi:ABC-type multidrug transport system ATPase subunit
MRQRLALAAALGMRSPLLILDDPFRGLDEDGRGTFLRWIGEARESGTTVVITSTDDRDLTAVCARIVRLDGGRIAQLRIARSAVSGV